MSVPEGETSDVPLVHEYAVRFYAYRNGGVRAPPIDELANFEPLFDMYIKTCYACLFVQCKEPMAMFRRGARDGAIITTKMCVPNGPTRIDID